ncbi:MAG: ABC transporter ATP-binding protein [Flavobacteriales bacterium]
MNCIQTHQLTHRFASGEVAVNALELQVPEGAVYGFLGPNGAGKTTTLRLILGLLRKQEGDIAIFGESLQSHRESILKQIGSLIESPSIYAHLSAKENLRVFQLLYDCPKSRIDAVLHQVGLANTGSKKVGKFSLGMKQRLSLAIALLHQPKLLILDEPSNGLDPNGMIEMREMIKHLNQQEGISILVSSHILAEVEKMVTHLGVIHQGSLRFQGTAAELQALRHQAGVRFEVSNTDTLKAHWHEPDVLFTSSNSFEIKNAAPHRIAEINRMITRSDVDVYAIVPLKQDLESIFLHLIHE